MRHSAALCALVVALAAGPAFASHRPPRAAFDPPRLVPLPPKAIRKCRQLQANAPFSVLCPSRLPRAKLHWRHGATPPPLTSDFYGDRFRPRRPGLLGLGFGYGAPIEPQSGAWFWRRRALFNRPAYFLHFTVWREGRERRPAGLRPRCYGTRCGLFRQADGYGLRRSTGYYWANHVWFFWREDGVAWVASLHFFGARDTNALFARILERVVPVTAL